MRGPAACVAASAAALALGGCGDAESLASSGRSAATTSGTPSGATSVRAHSTAAAANHGALVTDSRRGGFWIVSTRGKKQRLLPRGEHPIAVGGQKRIALARGSGSGPIEIVKAKRRVVLPHSDRSGVCATWSRNGRQLAYLAGKDIVYKRFPRHPDFRGRNVASAIRGSLWVAKASRPRRASRVASGLFPECPAWSPRGQKLAYLVRRESDRRAWSLRVRSRGRTRGVATSDTAAPSLLGPSINRSFDWEGKDSLVYVDDRGLFRAGAKSGRRVKLTPRSELAPLLQAARELPPGASHDWMLRVSPDGRNVALTITSAGSGVTSLDSGEFSLVTTLQPIFRGWAGSRGLLAQVNPGGPTGLSLSLDPIDGSHGQLIMEGFKCGLVEDPAGRWFAYDCGRAVTFHRADGSELNERPLGFTARAVAGIDESGRVSAAVWP